MLIPVAVVVRDFIQLLLHDPRDHLLHVFGRGRVPDHPWWALVPFFASFA